MSALAVLEANNNRERPIFLRSQWRAAPPKDDPDELVLASTLARLAGGSADHGHGGVQQRHVRAPRARRSRNEAAVAKPSSVQSRPQSVNTHIRNMTTFVQQHLEVKPCDEHHRNFWLPPKITAQQASLEEAAANALRSFGTKQNV